MMAHRRNFVALMLVALATSVSSLSAQTSVTSSSGAPSVTATETQYDAGGPTGTTTIWSVVAKCDNGGAACPVAISATSAVLNIDWEFTASPSPTGDCSGAPTALTFRNLSTAPTTIVTIQANKTCTISLAFRIRTLSYATQTAATTVQPVLLTVTKP
jgi:hypothetical protein